MKSEKIFKSVEKNDESITKLLVEVFDNGSKMQIAIVTERQVDSQSYFNYDNGISCEYIQLTPSDALQLADSIKNYFRKEEKK